MKRNSIKKASTFKLQAARSKFMSYLQEVQNCAVVTRFPKLASNIKQASEQVFEMCFNFNEESPFIRGLNYDDKYIGFSFLDNIAIYREYLPNISEAYLMGEFNHFNKDSHKLKADEEMGGDWYKVEIDLNVYRLHENTKIMLRVLDSIGVESHMIPPSCHLIDQGYGIYANRRPSIARSNKHKVCQLLAYTIDLETLPLEKLCLFIDEQKQFLDCYNTIIIKNLFKNNNGLLYKFSLTPEYSELLTNVIEKLNNHCCVKVVLEWNYEPFGPQYHDNPVQNIFTKPDENGQHHFNLSNSSVMAYYLANISHYFKYYGIGGIHFTKVHHLAKHPQGALVIRCINLLCDRLSEESITLASSKEFIPGLTDPILEGGFGFSFTYNFHDSLSLTEKHENIYELVKQIHTSSNCLSLNFNGISSKEYLYLLLSVVISKKGIFTRGPFHLLQKDIKKMLRLRKQEELFKEQAQIQRIDATCMIINRGNTKIIINFSQKELQIALPSPQSFDTLFNETEEELKITNSSITISPWNCILLEHH